MAPKDKVKEILLGDKSKVIYILEELGCHKINPNFSRNEIRCALPDGDTSSSVSVKLETYVPCYVFSRGEYDDYETKDIITLVQFINKCSFYEALDWLCSRLGVENNGEISYSETLQIVNELRKEKRKREKNDKTTPHVILNKSILKTYKPIVVPQWVEEGISPETQRKYGILNDEVGKRWLIPIYDEFGNLISLKGRTYAPNWKEMGVRKFTYYYKIGTNDILFGLNLNKKSIEEHDEIILFEAEKSVMAADSYTYDWGSSLGKNGINPHLKRKILSLKVSNCVIGFDNDVSMEAALKEAKKLSKYMNVYIMKNNGKLIEKQSPTDAGKEIFEEIYNSKIRVR